MKQFNALLLDFFETAHFRTSTTLTAPPSAVLAIVLHV